CAACTSCMAFSMEIDIVDRFPPLSAAFALLCDAVSSRNGLVHLFVSPVNPQWRSDFSPTGTGSVSLCADLRPRHPAMIPQCGFGLLVAVAATPLELWDRQPHERLEGAGQ